MKVNFLAEHIGACQMAYYLIKTSNQLVQEGEYQIIVFYDQMQRHNLRPAFPTMQLIEAWAQPGITIATSISTASRLLDFPGPSKKLFYVWDLEWLRAPQRAWGTLSDLFTHEDITLITRNEIHAKAIANCFNRQPEYLMDNFNVEQLKGILANESKTIRKP